MYITAVAAAAAAADAASVAADAAAAAAVSASFTFELLKQAKMAFRRKSDYGRKQKNIYEDVNFVEQKETYIHFQGQTNTAFVVLD